MNVPSNVFSVFLNQLNASLRIVIAQRLSNVLHIGPSTNRKSSALTSKLNTVTDMKWIKVLAEGKRVRRE